MGRSLRQYYSGTAVVLAPMEDVSDPPFRKVCRGLGGLELCFTEFVNVDALFRGDRHSQSKLQLAPEDRPTAIQIYGSDPRTLVEAAVLAERSGAPFVDVNCGCWVPRIAARGAGAGWLRDPKAMIEMAAQVVAAVSIPVSVKTRIGWGAETEMPIVDLARRLEDTGVSALTVHCRTAVMRHDGNADWTWAKRAQEVVEIPVLCNGDIRTAEDCARALSETGCAGVMIGRGAIDHPWVFREARALLDRGETLAPPTHEERLTFLLEILRANLAYKGDHDGVFCTRRHYPAVLKPVPGGEALRKALHATRSHIETIELLEVALEQVQSSHTVAA